MCLKFQHAWTLGLSPVHTSTISRYVNGWMWIEETPSYLIKLCVSVFMAQTTQALQQSDGQYHNTQAGQSTSPRPPIMSS